MDYNTDSTYVTSYFQEGSILLQFKENWIIVQNLPKEVAANPILVEVYAWKEENVLQQILESKEHIKGVPLCINKVGVYFLRLYVKEGQRDNYKGLLFRSDVPFYISERGHYRFIETIVTAPNKDFLNKLPDVDKIVCFQERTKIKQLAQKVVQYSHSTYEKILAIHDWVASNIYYDFDALQDLTDKKKCITEPVSVLNCKRSVCQGYCDLTVSLLKSIGIPAVGIICFALGLSSTGGWENIENLNAESNHIFPAAYCDSRWLLMDVTWDSNNEYRKGEYKKSEPSFSRKYFDITVRFLSNTHRLISVQ